MPRILSMALVLCCLCASGQELPEALNIAITGYESESAPPLIGRDRFVPDNMVRQALMSPDGRYVAGVQRYRESNRLILVDTTSLAEATLLENDRIMQVAWLQDSRHLVIELTDAVGMLDINDPGRAAYFTHLERQDEERVVGVRATGKPAVFVAGKSGDQFHLEEITADGQAAVVLQGNSQIEKVLPGADGELFLLLHDANGRKISRWKDQLTEQLVDCGLQAVEACGLLANDPANGSLWLQLHGDEDKAGLYAWRAGGLPERVHEDPQDRVDLDSAVFLGGQPVAAVYADATRRHYGLDPGSQSAIVELDALFPGSLLSLSTGSNGEWLVQRSAAFLRESEYYLFEYGNPPRRILEFEGSTAPLEPHWLSAAFALDYIASDGWQVPGFLVLPKGVDIATAPLLVNPHGGPWGRVGPGYDRIVQLLANRGYIVYQPNFRASVGYGKAHVLGANRDFGDGRVQLDITEGVRYLLANGIGNPEKVGIIGSSFGGFSVLSGLAFTPDLYQVGVAMVPPADLGYTLTYSLQQPSFVRGSPSISNRLRLLGGDFEDPAAMQVMYEKSPMAHLDRISKPLLVAAGADDDRIDVRHVKDYSLRLLNNGNQLALLIDEDEGHGFLSDEASTVSMYLAEQMLSLILGGRSQALDDTVLQHYLEKRLLLNNVPGYLPDLSVDYR